MIEQQGARMQAVAQTHRTTPPGHCQQQSLSNIAGFAVSVAGLQHESALINSREKRKAVGIFGMLC